MFRRAHSPNHGSVSVRECTGGNVSAVNPGTIAQRSHQFRHVGRQAVRVTAVPDGLDITASRTDNRLYLHVVNTRRTRAIEARLDVAGRTIQSGLLHEIAAEPEFEIMQTCPDAFQPTRRPLPRGGGWRIPAASVTAVEVELAS